MSSSSSSPDLLVPAGLVIVGLAAVTRLLTAVGFAVALSLATIEVFFACAALSVDAVTTFATTAFLGTACTDERGGSAFARDAAVGEVKTDLLFAVSIFCSLNDFDEGSTAKLGLKRG